MKTYLTMYIDSRGSKPSEVHRILGELGFRPTKGPHDFVYEWPAAKELQELMWFADKVHEALAETGVIFKLETVG